METNHRINVHKMHNRTHRSYAYPYVFSAALLLNPIRHYIGAFRGSSYASVSFSKLSSMNVVFWIRASRA